VGEGAERFGVVNEYLGYLADRRYSPRTVRSYAFDLLAFCRWLLAESIALGEVTTEVLLQFLAFCRQARLPGQAGGNVYSIRDGRAAGYAAATVNRRLVAIAGLFEYRALRDPDAVNAGCSAIWRARSRRRGYGYGSPSGCRAAWRRRRSRRCLRAFARSGIVRSRG
jgi:hypothetical protein